jgi:hypothetical protein
VIDFARYVRQVLVADVGEAGQRRIQACDAPVAGPTLAHEVASLYAKGAGVRAVTPGVIDVDALAPPACTTPEARAVLAGSRAALRVLLGAVRSEEAPRTDKAAGP